MSFSPPVRLPSPIPRHRKYKTFTKQLQAFADARGYVFLDQFRPGDMDIFYTKSKLGPRSKAKMLERLRSFFRFAVNREWLVKSPVSPDLKPPTGAHRLVNKAPFTDEQLEEIIRACDGINDFYGSGKWGNRYGNGTWTGEDLKDFIWLMVYTGLRISDVVLFDIERLHGNEVFLRAKKNGGDVFTHIPDWLRDRLNARVKLHGKRPFLIGGTNGSIRVIDKWRAAAREGVRARRRRQQNARRRTGFATLLRESCCRRACRLPMSRICSATMRRRCGSITPAGCRSAKPGSQEF